VSIGEDLAQARCRAGLSVTEVSWQTRIRETIICGIERDDYSACGGDFYARGHIRAIARAVGADPAPLIGEYDAAHPAPQAVTVTDLFGPAAGPAWNRRRHRRAWAVVLSLALAAGLGFAAYQVAAGVHRAPGGPAAAAASLHRPSHRPTHRPVTPLAAASPHAHKLVIHLTAVQDCWVEFTTPGGGYLFQSYVFGGTSRRWAFRHAVDMRLGNPGGIKLSVDGTNPLPPGTVEPITLRLRRHATVSS
jgi:cytoskeletal protein RodZ